MNHMNINISCQTANTNDTLISNYILAQPSGAQLLQIRSTHDAN
jgi:hypothetical protein